MKEKAEKESGKRKLISNLFLARNSAIVSVVRNIAKVRTKIADVHLWVKGRLLPAAWPFLSVTSPDDLAKQGTSSLQYHTPISILA
jgi:hypothetical protein